MSIIQGTSKSSAAGYSIDQSIRFNFSDAAHMLRTPSTASNRRTWTWSLWVKRSGLGNPGGPNQVHQLFGVGAGSCLRFTSSDQLRLESPAGNHTFVTSQVFRDTSAWYHIVLAFDSTQATDTDRRKLYVNGSQITDFSSTTFTGLAQNAEWDINSTSQHQIAKSNLADYFGGYLAEINFVDGTALDPTEFGETNADTGQWVPKRYTGSYPGNSFYITGADSADLGADDSGNGNDWTSSGLTSADQVSDSPTDNFCVLSSIDKNSNFTLSDGNLTNSNGTNAHAACFSTIAFDASDTDGWYWEVTMDSLQSTGFAVLIADEAVNQTDITTDPTTQPAEGNLWAHRRYNSVSDGAITGVGSTGSWTSYGPAAVVNDVIGYCVKNGKLFIAINNTWLASSDPDTETSPAFSNLTGNLRVGVNRFGDTGTDVTTLNFGQTGFTYTPPTGAKAISTANLPDPTIADPSAYFQTSLWNGNGSTQTITQDGNSTFQPGWIWSKGRNNAQEHVVFDEVRGTTKYLKVSPAGTEATQSGVTAFNSDGFDLGSWAGTNGSGQTHVGWQWKAGGTSGSSNTDGSLTSTVSADTTSGFSIATYTGNATVGATVGHGLGVAPKMVIVKSRSNAESWVVGHDSLGWTKGIYLNSTSTPFTLDIYWNNTAPTSSVVELHDHPTTNGNGYTYVMYSFAEIPGFSRFSSFVGNGSSDGPMIYTGFRPAHIVIREITTADSWEMYDSARDPINVTGRTVRADSANAEFDGRSLYRSVDFLSNGFKIRTSNATINSSGATFIFWAFAETPFKTATAR